VVTFSFAGVEPRAKIKPKGGKSPIFKMEKLQKGLLTGFSFEYWNWEKLLSFTYFFCFPKWS
jgi:hypothetical protein